MCQHIPGNNVNPGQFSRSDCHKIESRTLTGKMSTEHRMCNV